MTPLSDDPEKRKRQLRNLPNLRGEPSPSSWRPGVAPHLVHGGRTRAPEKSIIFREAHAALRETIRESFPHLLDGDGEVRPEFRLAVDGAAVQIVALRRLSAYLELKGHVDERGELRLAVLEAEQRAND